MSYRGYTYTRTSFTDWHTNKGIITLTWINYIRPDGETWSYWLNGVQEFDLKLFEAKICRLKN